MWPKQNRGITQVIYCISLNFQIILFLDIFECQKVISHLKQNMDITMRQDVPLMGYMMGQMEK